MMRTSTAVVLWATALAIMFFLAGSLLYDWLLAAVVNAKPGMGTVISTEANGPLVHRLATVSSFGFLGFTIGAALVVCRQQTAIGTAREYLRFALIAGGMMALCAAALRIRAAMFTDTSNAENFGMVPRLDDIPLYFLGALPGLCVVAYAAVLLIRKKRDGEG
jgi:hypothetical protein